MTARTDTDDWCDLIEAALADDTEASWARAAAGGLRIALPPGTDDALRHAERVADLVDRVRHRHLLTHDELDDVTEERRQLVVHARAATTYTQTDGPGPIERLLRIMWVG